jgi:hypothetical protein
LLFFKSYARGPRRVESNLMLDRLTDNPDSWDKKVRHPGRDNNKQTKALWLTQRDRE